MRMARMKIVSAVLTAAFLVAIAGPARAGLKNPAGTN